MVGFAAVGIVCAMAPNLPVLILGRTLQGCAGAAVPALATVAFARTFPAGRRGGALAMMASTVGVIALVAPAALNRRCRRLPHAFVPFDLFRNRYYVAAFFMRPVAVFVNLSVLMLVPLPVVEINGLSSRATRMVLTPHVLALALTFPLAGRFSDRVGGVCRSGSASGFSCARWRRFLCRPAPCRPRRTRWGCAVGAAQPGLEPICHREYWVSSSAKAPSGPYTLTLLRVCLHRNSRGTSLAFKTLSRELKGTAVFGDDANDVFRHAVWKLRLDFQGHFHFRAD